MYTIEIQEYDILTGTMVKQKQFDTVDEARVEYAKERKKDFDYGDHYRKTIKMW